MGDYVHRIGRTGRASDKGEAHTFLSSWGSEKEALFIIQIMEKANQNVPEELRKLSGPYGGGSGDWWKKDDENNGDSGDWWKKQEDNKGKDGGDCWKNDEDN